MDAEMKPCPADGFMHLVRVEGGEVLNVRKGELGSFYVSCSCGWRGPWRWHKADAIVAWNERVEPEEPEPEGGGWSLIDDVADRKHFDSLPALLDDLATRLIAIYHNLDGFASRDDAIISRFENVAQTLRDQIRDLGDRSEGFSRAILDLQRQRDEHRKRLALLEAVAGYGQRAERGEGEEG